MRTPPLAGIATALALLGLTLAGCASPAPAETPAVSAEPTPEPTIEPIVIGPAEMPPVPFGGDCAKALSVDDIAEVTGVTVAPEAPSQGEAMGNVGGLECEWLAANGDRVILALIPRAGLDGAVFPEDLAPTFFGPCTAGSYCAGQGGDDNAWVGVTLVAPEGTTQEDFDAWNEELGRRALENYAATADAPWTRDRAGWLPALDCGQVGDAISAQLGVPVAGQISGWDADRPPTGYVMALEASQQTACYLVLDEAQGASLTIWPGLGEALRADGATEVDFGIPGITAYEGAESDYRGRTHIMTDGVNRIDLGARTGDAEAQRRFAVAVAAAVASDFE